MKKGGKDIRSFAEAYPDQQIVKQLVSQLPWGHIIRLLQRIKDQNARLWYIKASIQQGWSRLVELLPLELKCSLPTVEEIEAELTRKADKS